MIQLNKLTFCTIFLFLFIFSNNVIGQNFYKESEFLSDEKNKKLDGIDEYYFILKKTGKNGKMAATKADGLQPALKCHKHNIVDCKKCSEECAKDKEIIEKKYEVRLNELRKKYKITVNGNDQTVESVEVNANRKDICSDVSIVECQFCQGSGKCYIKKCQSGRLPSRCNIVCAICNGTSKCLMCVGTGKSYKVDRTDPNDISYHMCPHCRGYDICTNCIGKGVKYRFVDNNCKQDKIKCPQCNGTGKCNKHMKIDNGGWFCDKLRDEYN